MNDHDQLERMLGRELHDRADGLGGVPFGLDEVKGRAGRIRRTRAALATGAVAAVAAALVPVALLVGGQDRADGPMPAPQPTVSDTANPAPETGPQGPAFMVDGEVHTADGATFTPAVSGETPWFARVGDGRWVFGVYDEAAGAFSIHLLDETGAELATFPAAESGLTSDGTSVAWTGGDGRLRVLQPGDDEPFAFPVSEGPEPQQLLQILGGDCATEECAVLVETYEDSGPAVFRVTQDGAAEQFLTDVLMTISDVSDDETLAAGATEITNEGSCNGVVEIETGTLLWETCEASALRFSPGGALVLGIDPYLDGANHSMQAVLDSATGEELARHETVIYDEAWDSPTSWLSIEGGFESSSVLRYTWNGAQLEVEAVHGPTTADAEVLPGSPYHLER